MNMFDENKSNSNDEIKKHPSVDIWEFINNIDNSNYEFYESLKDEDKKQFVPYTALRWVSALDDSVSCTFKSKNIEDIFGKWNKGAKELLEEFREQINAKHLKVLCTNITKYEHAQYDWRIKFSCTSLEATNIIKQELLTDFGINSLGNVQGCSKETAQFELMLLNDLVNSNLWDMQKHPDLVYRLMCTTQKIVKDGEMKRSWIPFCKGLKNVNAEIFNIMKQQLPALSAAQFNITEYKIMLNSYTKEEFKQILIDMGNDKSSVSALMKLYNSEMEKYGTNKESTED